MARGLYIHIPFCLQKCAYCDFVSFTCGNREEYINKLCRELKLWKGEKIDSIFIGGGTPTSLPSSLLEKLFSSVNSVFNILPGAEWTIEANPGTMTDEKLRIIKSFGANRISIGVQSFIDNELKLLGRIHTAKEAKNSLILARKYFSNINIDLMSAICEQTLSSFLFSLNTALSFEPEHLSCYSLILEENTPLYNENQKKPLPLPDEDEERDIYYCLCETMEKYGYLHYEISNFARTSFSCRHNLKYWRCEEYIGAGLAAHSYIDSKRIANTSNMSEYLAGSIQKESVLLSDKDKISEFIIMSLRLNEGVDTNEYSKRFKRDFYSDYRNIIDKFLSLHLLRRTSSGFGLTKTGIDVSNSVMCEFV